MPTYKVYNCPDAYFDNPDAKYIDFEIVIAEDEYHANEIIEETGLTVLSIQLLIPD